MIVDKTYWQYKGAIPTSLKEKEECLKYEIDMYGPLSLCYTN